MSYDLRWMCCSSRCFRPSQNRLCAYPQEAHRDLKEPSTSEYSTVSRSSGFCKSLNNRSLLDALCVDCADCCVLQRYLFILPNRRRTDCQKYPGPRWDGKDEGHQDHANYGQVRRWRRLHRRGGPGEPAPEPAAADICAAGDDGGAGLRRQRWLADSALWREERSRV